MGLYRENAIAIESEARDPFGGNVYYVTMQIAHNERNLHCDVVHVTTKWVSRLVLDHGSQRSRRRDKGLNAIIMTYFARNLMVLLCD